MPTLDWIGKKAVVNHHRQVPFHLLKADPALSAGNPDSGNLLLQGDNLLALKALLPYYAGQIKCIYIDPPYNTGNENWVYNDNTNAPEIKKWLGKTVGHESEDLSRHDKWLCMMYPRLQLLNQMLHEDGVILISIDDFEAHRLREIMGEIFGHQNFIAQLVWDKTRKNDAKLFSVGHEYVLVFAKSLAHLKEKNTIWREQKPGTREILEEWRRLKEVHGTDYESMQIALREWYKQLPKNHPAKKQSRHKWIDKNGPWRDRDISWPGGGGPRYDVPHDVTGIPCKVPERGWGFATWEEMQRQIKLGLVQFREDHTSPPFRKAHLIPVDGEEFAEQDQTESEDDEAGMLVMGSVIQKQAQVAVKMLRELFGGKKVFQNPKDHEVIARLIGYVSDSEALILDSFAGSGTTGHAVMKLNAADGGNRRFILIEMEENIAQSITAERLKRVLPTLTPGGNPGVSAANPSKPSATPLLDPQTTAPERKSPDLPSPTAPGFQYCTLGEPLFDASGQINAPVKFPDLARHIFFSETGHPPAKAPTRKSPLIGIHHNTAYYLLFNGILGDKRPQAGNVLTNATLADLPPHDGPKIIYGEATRLSPARLARENITFKQLPYEIKTT